MMKKIRSILIAACLAVLSTNAAAAYVWSNPGAGPYKVTNVAYFWDGSNDVVQVTLSAPLPVSGCVAANTTVVAFWGNGSANTGGFQVRLSAAEAAFATGAFVDIEVDNGNCSAAYGPAYHGIRIHGS